MHYLNFDVEAVLLILIVVSILANAAVAYAFIVLTRWLMKPEKETLFFYDKPDTLEEEVLDFDPYSAFARQDTTPIPTVNEQI